MSISGECFCGKIQYQISGVLFDARSCHCSRCRKVFSGQASAYALVNSDEFSWLNGEDLLSTFTNKDGVGYQFCSHCGSTLCGFVAGKIHGVTLGCINGDPKITLEKHIFVDSKASWETIGGDVPQYPQGDESKSN